MGCVNVSTRRPIKGNIYITSNTTIKQPHFHLKFGEGKIQGKSEGEFHHAKKKSKNKSRDALIDYQIVSILGEGTYAKVYKVKHKKTGTIRAMKVCSLEQNQDVSDKVKLKEFDLLVSLDHPNIVKVYDSYKTEKSIQLILQYINGGELFSSVKNISRFTEDTVRFIMMQLFSTVSYLHGKNLMHRDLKPENILVDYKSENRPENLEEVTDNDFNIVLIDFGTCSYFEYDTKYNKNIGSPYYIAPEILRREYDNKCDIWSCGVIMYLLLCGSPPFKGNSTRDILINILRGEYSMEGEDWEEISPLAKDFIRRLLEYDPAKRISASEALRDPWFSESKLKKNNSLLSKSAKGISNFAAKEKFHQAIVSYIIDYNVSCKNLKELKVFSEEISSGLETKLSKSEISNILENYFKLNACNNSIGSNEVNRLLDLVESEHIELKEFFKRILENQTYSQRTILRKAYENLLSDRGARSLTRDELLSLLFIEEEGYVKQIYDRMKDQKQDTFSYEEFLSVITLTLGHL